MCPPRCVERERDIYRAQAEAEGKPPKAVESIVEGRLKKFYAEFCLVEQAFIKNPDLAIKDLVSAKVLSTGENIKISRFVRFEIGK